MAAVAAMAIRENFIVIVQGLAAESVEVRLERCEGGSKRQSERGPAQHRSMTRVVTLKILTLYTVPAMHIGPATSLEIENGLESAPGAAGRGRLRQLGKET